MAAAQGGDVADAGAGGVPAAGVRGAGGARAYRAAGADMVFVDGLRTREAIERAASELAGIPQVLNTHLLTHTEAQAMGFALFIQRGFMLRHFADFWAALNERRDTGNVTLRPDDASIDAISELLLDGVVRNA